MTVAFFSLRSRLLSAATASPPEDKGLEPIPRKDEDPDGLKLVLDKDPLERADKCLAGLVELVPKNMEVCFATYDVAVRRSERNLAAWSHEDMSNLATEKYLQAVKMLIRARSLDPEHPDLHVRIAHLRNTGKINPSLTPLVDDSW